MKPQLITAFFLIDFGSQEETKAIHKEENSVDQKRGITEEWSNPNKWRHDMFHLKPQIATK